MPENKKNVKKTISKIFLIISLVIAALAFTVSVYLGGQMKTINKYALALERGDYKMYSECFTPEYEYMETKEEFESGDWSELLEEYNLSEDEKIHVKFKFIKREFVSFSEYRVIVEETFYSDNFTLTDNGMGKLEFPMHLINGKWYCEKLHIMVNLSYFMSPMIE